MQPQATPTTATPSIPSTGYLSTAQVQAARSSIGMNPTGNPQTPSGPDLVSQLQSGTLGKTPNVASDVEDTAKNYVEGTVNNMQESGKNVDADIEGAGQQISKGELEGKTPQGNQDVITGVIKGGARTAGDFIGGLFSPVTQALKMATDQVRTSDPKLAAGYDSVINKIADTISNSPEIQQLAMAHPNAGADFGRALNIAGTAELGGDGETPAEKPATEEGTTTPPKEVANEDVTPPSGGEPALSPDIIASRIKDATPNLNEKMIGTNVMTPDTIDDEGNTVKGKITPRVAKEGTTSERPVTTSSSEHAQGTELQNVPDYPDNGTALEKGLAVQKANVTEAENMRSGLQQEDQSNPLDTESEKIKEQTLVKSKLPDEVQNALGTLSPEDETMVRGMYEKAGIPVPEGGLDVRLPGEKTTLPKTAANAYFQDVSDAVDNYNGTREGKLDLRQKIDDAFERHNGKYTHGSDAQNQLYEYHTGIRNAVNDDLHDSTTDTDTRASLKKQTNLYRAQETLFDKARAEDPTSFGRFMQRNPLLRYVQRQIIRRSIGSVL